MIGLWYLLCGFAAIRLWERYNAVAHPEIVALPAQRRPRTYNRRLAWVVGWCLQRRVSATAGVVLTGCGVAAGASGNRFGYVMIVVAGVPVYRAIPDFSVPTASPPPKIVVLPQLFDQFDEDDFYT